MHKHLEKLLAEAEKEHQEMWAIASADPMRRPAAWGTKQEAMQANPGFSINAFAQADDGLWRVA